MSLYAAWGEYSHVLPPTTTPDHELLAAAVMRLDSSFMRSGDGLRIRKSVRSLMMAVRILSTRLLSGPATLMVIPSGSPDLGCVIARSNPSSCAAERPLSDERS